MIIFTSKRRILKTGLSKDEIFNRLQNLIKDKAYQGFWEKDNLYLNQVPKRLLGALSKPPLFTYDFRIKVLVEENENCVEAKTIVPENVQNIISVVYVVLLIMQVLAILSLFSKQNSIILIFFPVFILLASYFVIRISIWLVSERFYDDLKFYFK